MKTYLTLLVIAAFIGCNKTQNNQSNSQASSKPPSAIHNVSLLQSTQESKGEHAPDFTWTDSTGNTVHFSEIAKGKPVLINFWATWCGPCRKETPDLVSVYNEYKQKGALVIGISADRDADALTLVSDFTKEFNVDYPVVIDNGDLEKAFGGLRGYPTTIYIDKNGMIVKKMIGLQSKEKFINEFDALL